MRDLDIIVVHSLPGRLRLRLIRAPRSTNNMLLQISKHDGILLGSFNPISKSLLVHYNPSVVSATEIIVRAAMALSVDYKNSSVKITNRALDRALKPIDYLSGLALGIAGLARVAKIGPSSIKYLSYGAGTSTVLAVIYHAWLEVKKDGIYDPEVISVVYLINSLIKGNFLTASIVTWIATFGRHLFEPIKETCVLDAYEIVGEDEQPYIDVSIRPVVNKQFISNPLRVAVFGLGRFIGINPRKYQTGFMEQIRQMSRKHGNILEGIGNKPSPVYMRLD
ncbi:hypothetical protein KPL47_16195 [Clostridium estertheticum]|uniref:hypothetical protein n=1 Tax=Clostridium estertheticum TaxID=238834 RepID=UPI001C0C5A3E|nr:hypothetical protein [Clostridium estertheticum]MBU3177871.1 hypothetical protein [Clostridium estertheticum]